MAGYRRIMPPPGDPDRYSKFLFAQNQVSVYSETAASKRREECAKRQRLELEKKKKENLPPKGEEEDFKIAMKKKKPSKIPLAAKTDGFQIEMISDHEEKERCALLSQREFLIRSCGLIQMVKS